MVHLFIDGTQVALCRPEYEHLYLNRHEIHSMNVSLICDHEQKFIAVDATHPGATHDAAIWNTSEERKFMQEIYNRGERIWLLGDSGYPLEPWLITPYRSPTDRLQTEFNHKFSRIRTIIENTIGILKNRWRILLTTQRVLRYDPCKMIRVINVCVALHNLCKMRNIPDLPSGPAIIQEDLARGAVPEDRYLENRQILRELGRQNRLLLHQYIL